MMINIADVSVQYPEGGERYALRDIRLTIAEGERTALIGANGAGKSTLLLTLCGVLGTCAGEITVCGMRLEKKSLRDVRKHIGMLFQNPDDQLFMPTVYEDIAFGPRNYGLAEADIALRTETVLERLGITPLKGRLASKLSGGEKRLAALAGVLVLEPSLLLMDEPSSFLDPGARRRLIRVLMDLPQTMLMATHDLDFALDLCERAVILKEGTVYADGKANEVLRDGALLTECGLELPLSMGG